MYSQPQVLHKLLGRLADSVTDYLNAQIRAGAQAVQIFDTWGGVLGHREYREFSLAYMQRIVAGLTSEHEGRAVPVILFTKNGGQWLEVMADAGADALGLDWTTHIGDARQRVGDRVALQGNMDPSVLYGSPCADSWKRCSVFLMTLVPAMVTFSTLVMVFTSLLNRSEPLHLLRRYTSSLCVKR